MTETKMFGLGLLLAALAVTGCKNETATPTAEPPAVDGEADVADHGYDHADGDHAHEPADHAPHGSGPNGGVVFDLGAYHAEFTVDHPAEKVMILMLGDDGQTPVQVAAQELTLTTQQTQTEEGTTVPPMTITLQPVDAVDGKASKFQGTDPGIGNVADFQGTVLGEIDGKPAQGEFEE